MLNNIRTKLFVIFALVSVSSMIAGLSFLPYGAIWDGEGGNNRRDADEINISIINITLEQPESDRVSSTIDRNDTDLRDSYHDNRRDMAIDNQAGEPESQAPRVRKVQNTIQIIDATNFKELEQKRNAASTLGHQYFKSYSVTDLGKQLVTECNQDPGLLRSLTGLELQHQLHAEFIQIIDRSAAQYYNKSLPSNLREFHKDLAEITIVGIKQNNFRNTAKASSIANFCWAALDYGKVLGSYVNNTLQLTTDFINNASSYGQIVIDKLAQVTEQFLLTDTARLIAPYFSARIQASHKLAALISNNQLSMEKGFTPEQKKIFIDNLHKELFNYECKVNVQAVNDFTAGLFTGSAGVFKNIAHDPAKYITSFITMPLKPLVYGVQKIIQYRAISSIAEHDPELALSLIQELNVEIKKDFDDLYKQVSEFSKLSFKDRGKVIGSMVTDALIANKIVFPTINSTVKMLRNRYPNTPNIQPIEAVLQRVRHQKPEYITDLLSIKIASYSQGEVIAAGQIRNTPFIALLNEGKANLAIKSNLIAPFKGSREALALCSAANAGNGATSSLVKRYLAASVAGSAVEGLEQAPLLKSNQEIFPEQPFCEIEAEKILADSQELKELNMTLDVIEPNLDKTVYLSNYTNELDVRAYEKINELAENLYEKIRSDVTDVRKISENIGVSEVIVQDIKNHVFYNIHKLDSAMSRFHSDLDIAEAWLRLIEKTHAKSDLLWLKHEFAESLIMRANNIDARTAHNFVDTYYDWHAVIKGK